MSEVIEIVDLTDLPMDVELELYQPPWFTEDEIAEVAQQFKVKHGREPKEIFRYDKSIYVW